MKLQVITGRATHYVNQSHSEPYWVVAVYEDLTLAERHLERIKEVTEGVLEEIRQGTLKADIYGRAAEDNKRLRESGLDLNANMDSFQAEYRIDEIEIRAYVPGDPLPLALAGAPNGRLRASELAART
jgi:hypothetical protein